MNVVFMGPPGVGKGTQARVLTARYDLKPVATGELIRAEVAAGTSLGLEVGKYIDAGNLVPDDLILRMVEGALVRDGRAGFLLDGFPRTIPQAEGLDHLLAGLGRTVNAVVSLAISEDKVVNRLGCRRICPVCGRVYNLQQLAPRVAGRCDDHPEAELTQRSDDVPDTVRRRLEVYRVQTAPLVEYYRQRGLLREVDADGSVDDVTRRIEAVLAR